MLAYAPSVHAPPHLDALERHPPLFDAFDSLCSRTPPLRAYEGALRLPSLA